MTQTNAFKVVKQAPTIQQVKKHLAALVSFDTTNPPRQIKESGILEYLTANLAGAQIDVINYGNGSINILATKGTPQYLFNYHIDTVPVTEGWESNPFELIEEGGKLYGLGACDIKGAAACLLACIESGLENYAVLFSSDEEHGNSLCVRSFLEQKHQYQGVVVAEPTQAKAVLAHRGIITATISFEAESGHSSEPRALTDNSNHQAAQWIVDAKGWASQKLEESFESLTGTCFNVGKIEGGIKPNIIAPMATIKFGLRPLPGKSVTLTLEELVNATELNDEQLSVGFKAPSLPAKDSVEQNQALAKNLGLSVGDPVNFWTEAALFSEAGYPSIVYGPGSIEQAHTANEWVDIKELEEVLAEYWRILHHE